MSEQHPTFSIILPFYGQTGQVEAVVNEFRERLMELHESFEFIVVINGVGQLDEPQVITTSPITPEVKTIELRESGWGRAVKCGIAEAKGKYICYTNSARTKGTELERVLRYALVSSDEIVKATRIERSGAMRKWVSIFYNMENRILLKTPIWDVNATPKVIPKVILDQIKLVSDGDVIDAELMYKCFLLNIPVIEIPIKQTTRRAGSSSTNWKSAFRMFIGLIKLRRILRPKL